MKKSLKGAHSTFIDGAEDFIKVLEKSKIKYSLGIIKTELKKSDKFFKIKKNKLIIRDNISIQEIIIYSDLENLEKIIFSDKKNQKKMKKGFRFFK